MALTATETPATAYTLILKDCSRILSIGASFTWICEDREQSESSGDEWEISALGDMNGEEKRWWGWEEDGIKISLLNNNGIKVMDCFEDDSSGRHRWLAHKYIILDSFQYNSQAYELSLSTVFPTLIFNILTHLTWFQPSSADTLRHSTDLSSGQALSSAPLVTSFSVHHFPEQLLGRSMV